MKIINKDFSYCTLSMLAGISVQAGLLTFMMLLNMYKVDSQIPDYAKYASASAASAIGTLVSLGVFRYLKNKNIEDEKEHLIPKNQLA